MSEKAIVLGHREGRQYPLGTMTAVFKADGPETGGRYSISEWWLQAHTKGPGPHSHADNDELFYVIEGVASVLIGTAWFEAPRGTFVRVPAGITHDFENRSSAETGLLNVFIPGGFEQNMASIVDWYAQHPNA